MKLQKNYGILVESEKATLLLIVFVRRRLEFKGKIEGTDLVSMDNRIDPFSDIKSDPLFEFLECNQSIKSRI